MLSPYPALLGRCDNPAGTHINICAVLSLQGRHGHALEHAQLALDLTIKNDEDSPGEQSSAPREGDGTVDPKGDDSEASAKPNPQKAEMLPVAYHNLAVECEHLGKYDDAMEAYLQAANIARQRLGPKDPLTVAMQGALDAALQAAKDGTRKAPALQQKKATGSKTHRGGGSSAPWEANKTVTPRTRHKQSCDVEHSPKLPPFALNLSALEL